MGLAVIKSRALIGLTAHEIHVEVHLANGLPSFTLVGLADTEVKEARERVRCAILNSGLQFPSNQRITVNLAPADIPKESGRFDLPIALGILSASGHIDSSRLATYEFAGELSLTGELRPIRGALALMLALSCEPMTPQLVLPMESAQEAALVPNTVVYGANHLLQVVEYFAPASASEASAATAVLTRVTPVHQSRAVQAPDMTDVKGQSAPKRALEIAAAGGHSLLMVGPPGSGKSMLAHRFAGLLPAMKMEEALQSAAVRSLAGRFSVDQWAIRPTASPHHSASAVALVGGGSPPKPGEISLVHHGVLFLDELPEFPKSALEALREPLETGLISITRAAQSAEFPAKFQLIAAMNPCPCGFYGATHQACRCSAEKVLRYQNKLSGPLLDRIDLHIEVPAIAAEEVLRANTGENSANIQARCQKARNFSLARQGKNNAQLHGKEIDQYVQVEDAALTFLQKTAERLGWSARGMHRALKIARTIADLAQSEHITTAHVAESIQYRRALQKKE